MAEVTLDAVLAAQSQAATALAKAEQADKDVLSATKRAARLKAEWQTAVTAAAAIKEAFTKAVKK